MIDNTINPDTRIGALLLFLRSNTDEVLLRGDVAIKLGCAAAAVDGLLSPYVASGLVTIASDPEHGRVWRAGRLLNSAQVMRGSAPTAGPSVQPPVAKPASKRGGMRTHLPALDLTALTVADDAPVPDSLSARGRTRYDAVFDKLTADGKSVSDIPNCYYGAIAKALQSYMAHRPALAANSVIVLRRPSAEAFGLWRLAKPARVATVGGAV